MYIIESNQRYDKDKKHFYDLLNSELEQNTA
jgi:hypothetical protein